MFMLPTPSCVLLQRKAPILTSQVSSYSFSLSLPPPLWKKPVIRRACVMLYICSGRRESKALLYTSSSSSCRSPRPCFVWILEGGRESRARLRPGEMGLRPLNRLGFLLVLVVCCGGGTEQRRAEAADGTSSHRMLTTVSVSKPSYPTVTTPMSAYVDPRTAPGRPPSTFPSLAAANGGGGGGTWCVASQSANPTSLQVALDYACGYGADCSAIQPGGSCFDPDTVHDHASYAFNSYYQKNPIPTSCDFGGTATLTTTDPSSGSCKYQASSGGAQGLNTTAPPSPTTLTPTVPMTPTPTMPDTTPTTGTPVYGSMAPPDYGSMSPPDSGSTSPPDYNDVGAAATTGHGSAALAFLCVLFATISLHISK
ncbi:uncharacterized protein LOC133909992 [Phragmites australis]|uniref:uncharacterized protein LOC133909992 n=1 Tax=Phragmites australis TaxID=29695 RepID=UPI002D784B44|nr:uncharacterized protein LOC133909992 [Phragmites australis]